MEKKNLPIVKIVLGYFLVMALSALTALALRMGLVLSAVVLFAAMSAAFSAVLLLSGKKWAYLLCLPVFEIAFLITGNLFLSLFFLVFALAGTFLSDGLRTGSPRVSVMLQTALSFGGVAVVLAVIAYLTAGHAFSSLIPDVRAWFDAWEAELLATFREPLDAYLSALSGSLPKELAETLTADYLIESAVTALKTVSLALTIVLFSVTAFLSYYLGLLFTRIFGFYPLIPGRKAEFLPSRISAILFLVSYLCQVIASLGASSLFFSYLYVVAINLSLILLPVFLVMGVKGWRIRYRRPTTHGFAVVLLIVCAVTLFLSVSLPFYLLAFLGAWDTLAIYKIQQLSNDSGKE
ncbi:MAG: hypothetical protein KBS76_07285 [Ruminococcus sp.]|nr:hypothetical protein [Candidatus Apopatosoma intestinale]